jgi:(p)ppGpp synthase/HD superfamily hydrolase
VIEDTSIDLREIASRFGEGICELVEEMTERRELEPYSTRKAEHRARVARDPRAAAIYAADKLARARELSSGVRPAMPEQLEHYRESLRVLRERYPDLPFLTELERELNRARGREERA